MMYTVYILYIERERVRDDIYCIYIERERVREGLMEGVEGASGGFTLSAPCFQMIYESWMSKYSPAPSNLTQSQTI